MPDNEEVVPVQVVQSGYEVNMQWWKFSDGHFVQRNLEQGWEVITCTCGGHSWPYIPKTWNDCQHIRIAKILLKTGE